MIKRFSIACACLALTACGLAATGSEPQGNSNAAVANSPAPAPVSAPVAAPSGPQRDCALASGQTFDEKALWAAEAIYNGPANAYVNFDAAGQMPPALKAQVRPLLIKGYDALKAARGAYAVGDSCGFFDHVKTMTYFVSTAKALMPKPK